MKDTCPDCGGQGFHIFPECCGRMRAPNGDCCGEPFPATEQCTFCYGTGEVEIPDVPSTNNGQ